MNDSEFLEILNLYLDHEISPADAARLEAEVQANPGRRRIYVEYCRMQKACTLLGQQAPAAAPAVELVRPAAAYSRRPVWNAGVAFGGLAAAACIAAIVVLRTRSSGPAAAEASVAFAQAAVPAALPAEQPALKPVLAARDLPSLAGSPVAPGPASPQLNDQFAWMDRLQLSPVQGNSIEPTLFEPAPVFQDAETRAIHPAPGQQFPVERAAFQFQR